MRPRDEGRSDQRRRLSARRRQAGAQIPLPLHRRQSAGAIAAGAAAAAEYGRAQGGFVKFEALGQSLAAEGALLNLFQAPPATRPLLDTIKAALPLVAPLAATQDAARAVGRAPGPVAARWALPHVARLLRGTDADAFGGGAWRGRRSGRCWACCWRSRWPASSPR